LSLDISANFQASWFFLANLIFEGQTFTVWVINLFPIFIVFLIQPGMTIININNSNIYELFFQFQQNLLLNDHVEFH
jgi:hypothetical protein